MPTLQEELNKYTARLAERATALEEKFTAPETTETLDFSGLDAVADRLDALTGGEATIEHAPDDILNEFSTDFRAKGDKALEQYVREYPELTEALYEHAGLARMFRHLPDAKMTPEEEELRTLKSISLVVPTKDEPKDSNAPEAEAPTNHTIQ